MPPNLVLLPKLMKELRMMAVMEVLVVMPKKKKVKVMLRVTLKLMMVLLKKKRKMMLELVEASFIQKCPVGTPAALETETTGRGKSSHCSHGLGERRGWKSQDGGSRAEPSLAANGKT